MSNAQTQAASSLAGNQRFHKKVGSVPPLKTESGGPVLENKGRKCCQSDLFSPSPS